ncbi:B-cell CLL/lymphoma 7 protein family member A isoform X2 [Hylobates moloch]|uniref:B-cell CLL/lymphoma 7 protein family member A isoform X2 n=1 Tax=Hylobates moloch TaxID=81572 RepID=UPI00267507D2|nr:B-cell CLL/lymphoma 7 protein family member A isoform X2 [Hylobates moloch]
MFSLRLEKLLVSGAAGDRGPPGLGKPGAGIRGARRTPGGGGAIPTSTTRGSARLCPVMAGNCPEQAGLSNFVAPRPVTSRDPSHFHPKLRTVSPIGLCLGRSPLLGLPSLFTLTQSFYLRRWCRLTHMAATTTGSDVRSWLKNKNKKKGKDEKCGSEVTTPENSSSPGMMDMHDDNSNQSSIADASPIKQENSSNSSPAPEPNSAVPSDGTEAKADEAQADGKEHPGAEDASDEQNSQSSMEHSMNSSEKVDRQPSGDSGLVAETSAISQDLEGVPPSKKMKLEASQQNSEEM